MDTSIAQAPLPAPTSSRWVGVGRSTAVHAATAGAEAISSALGDRAPTLVLVFCAHDYDLPALLEPVRSELPAGAVMAGCTTNGQLCRSIDDPAADDPDAGVVVVAMGGDGLEARVRAVAGVSARRREAGAEVAGVVDGLGREQRLCLVLADGLTREQHEIVRGCYQQLGAAVPIVGGCSGDGIQYVRTYQFHGDREGFEVLSDGLVGVGIGSDGPIGVGVAHGWRKTGEAMLVTASVGGRVFEINDRPALDVYLEHLGTDRTFAHDEAAFRDAAFEAPLGMARRTGEDIRVVHGADLDDGSLLCLADVPQGAMAWMMATDSTSLVEAAAESARQAIAELDGAEPAGLVVFDCGARKGMLGRVGLADEVGAIAAAVGGAPFGGFYTFGEIARTRGSRGMHHFTVVSMAVG